MTCGSRDCGICRAAGGLPLLRARQQPKLPRHGSRLLDKATMSPMPGSDFVKPAHSGVRLTYDDFVLFPDDGQRHELIDGEHYVTPSPNMKHQAVLGNLYFLIRSHLETQPSGRAFMAPFDVVFTDFDVVEPDLL